ncbi:FAD/NAD(P)-binding domain-containing protein [Meira miltonrushii]|uniref:FAD/NAD(P)-binding domain-containing protein n=1 Tax=Meira miltonrushii TaxID=1280837 RepID=A0A316V7X1_9BASI|nr:FAD/NAD(P)-binding domain-containing protein [Meira miltonrushii]PWN33600.1 FAD/NAD(P)-binding domain-containing protein [Meira miltonrushii]
MNGNGRTSDVDLDVVIVGAGIGGISAAYYIGQMEKYSYGIFEAREALGGTWSSFTYPGIRSDSDMFTLSFPFNPWNKSNTVAEGGEILEYIEETAKKFGIDKKIVYGHTATNMDWSSKDQRWTSEFKKTDGSSIVVTSRFVVVATGYFDHNEAYFPDLPKKELFKGPIIHPQFWPKGVDYENKTVAVIGSGATAISIVPHMADKAKLVTMVQRSPTYITSRSRVDPAAQWLLKLLPLKLASIILFLFYELETTIMFFTYKIFPNYGRRVLQNYVKKQLPPNVPLDPHFVPKYKPFDERLCWVLEDDLFVSMREGKAAVVTGHIKQLTSGGIEMQDGQFVPADIIVQATGLKCKFLGGAKIRIDGKKLNLGDTFFYRGMMLDGVPNGIALQGYLSTSSWTLGVVQTCEYFCDLLKKMEKEGYRQVTPIAGPEVKATTEPFPMTSGYLMRALDQMPKVADGLVWRHHLDPIVDWLDMKFNRRYQSLEFK